MQYSLIFFFALFSINNLLHYINEKVIIVIFIGFTYVLTKFLSNIINLEFRDKIKIILSDVNMYMNAIFNFLYINKLIYLNYRQLNLSFKKLFKFFQNKVLLLKLNNLFNKRSAFLLNHTI